MSQGVECYSCLPKTAWPSDFDAGGIDDRSFNATAWKGVQDAIAQLGIDGKYLESQQQKSDRSHVVL